MIKNIWYLLLIILFSNNVKAENLIEVIQLAFDNNYDYKSKVETFNADYAYKDLAKSYLLPKLDLQEKINLERASKTYEHYGTASYGFDDSNENIFSISLVQPLYNPSAWAYYSQGKLNAQRAQIVLDKEKNNLILKVAEAYFNVLSAQDDMEYSKAETDSLSNYMKEITAKANIGQAKKADVDEVKAKYELLKYNNLVRENNLKVKQDALNKILNLNLLKISKLKENIKDLKIKENDISIWKERAKEQNLDILSTKLAILLADEDIQIASSNYYPNISIFGSIGLKKGVDPIMQDAVKSKSISVGISLNINLYEGGATKQKRKQAQYKKNSADFSLKELENNIENLTTQYYLNVDNGVSQLEALRQSIISSEVSLNSAKKSYSVGLRTTTDVLVATESYFSTKRDYSKSKYNYLLSILALKSITGNVSKEDIALINTFLE